MNTDALATLSGRQVGAYTLGRCLESSAHAALYETEFGGTPAILKLQDETPGLLDQWRNAQQLEHPDLIRILDAGTTELDGVMVFVVRERADETLADVLAERQLNDEEAREMLAPTVSAVQFLHEKGWAHGSIQPSNFVAVGEEMKLASDTIHPSRGPHDQADDVRALGAMLVEALTGRTEAALPENIHDDLRILARNTRSTDPAQRWTMQQVAEYLKTGALPSIVSAPPRKTPEPTFAAVPSYAGQAPGTTERRGPPKWVYGALGAGAIALLAIFAIGSKKQQVAPERSVSAPSTAAVVNKPDPREPIASYASRSAGSKSETGPTSRNYKAGWAVVVASYADRTAAERRKQTMAKRWRHFKLDVLAEPGAHPLYLVVIGQGLSEGEAAGIRRRAVSSGLPRDTYIRRFS